MRRSIVTGVILLFVLALVTGPWSKPAVAQQRSNAPQREEPLTVAEPDHPVLPKATALLMIVGDPLRPAPGLERATAGPVLGWLINSWSVQGREPQEIRDNNVSFTYYPGSAENHTLALLVVSGRGDLEKVLALAQKRLQEALLEIHRLSMEPLDRKMNVAEKRRIRAEEMISHVTGELQKLRETAIRTGEALQPQDPQVSAAVRRDHLALRAELAGLQAQREAIVEQIAKAKLKVDAAQKDQRLVLEQLAQVVSLKEQELARTRTLHQKGVATQAEVSKAEVALAQARADLADRRLLLVNRVGGQQLGRLNEQLVETQIAITTAAARLEETEKALEELKEFAYSPVSPLVIKYQRTRRALESAFAEQEAAAAELARLKMALQAIPAPKVIQIGGEAKPK